MFIITNIYNCHARLHTYLLIVYTYVKRTRKEEKHAQNITAMNDYRT